MAMNAQEVYEIGIGIEENGRLFYLKAADSVEDDDLKRFYRELADWENQHVDTFRKLSTQLADQPIELDGDVDDQYHRYLRETADAHVFRSDADVPSLIAGCDSPLEVLRLALAFEKDSVVVYTSMKKVVPEKLGKESIDRLIDEEIKHVTMINAKIATLA